jgi:hypothetical protein
MPLLYSGLFRGKSHQESLSRYSPGTSSSGTSCVWTSFSSASSASSTPFTTSASNAFPSSSNSSTLSESAPSRLDNPCRPPDWPAAGAGSRSREKARPGARLRFRAGFLAARNFFAVVVFLRAAGFDVRRFLVLFFLGAILAVYHRGVCSRKTARGFEVARCIERLSSTPVVICSNGYAFCGRHSRALRLEVHLGSESKDYGTVRSSAHVCVILNNRLQKNHRCDIQQGVKFSPVLRLKWWCARRNEAPLVVNKDQLGTPLS